MTNAEKYLKDGVSVKEFARVILEETTFDPKQEDIIAFLNKPCKPTLTEDERVILKYVDGEYTHIQRADGLWLIHYEDEYTVHQMSFEMYAHLFQFAKERRRILY